MPLHHRDNCTTNVQDTAQAIAGAYAKAEGDKFLNYPYRHLDDYDSYYLR